MFKEFSVTSIRSSVFLGLSSITPSARSKPSSTNIHKKTYSIDS